jgi:hypothetical protein
MGVLDFKLPNIVALFSFNRVIIQHGRKCKSYQSLGQVRVVRRQFILYIMRIFMESLY